MSVQGRHHLQRSSSLTEKRQGHCHLKDPWVRLVVERRASSVRGLLAPWPAAVLRLTMLTTTLRRSLPHSLPGAAAALAVQSGEHVLTSATP